MSWVLSALNTEQSFEVAFASGIGRLNGPLSMKYLDSVRARVSWYTPNDPMEAIIVWSWSTDGGNSEEGTSITTPLLFCESSSPGFAIRTLSRRPCVQPSLISPLNSGLSAGFLDSQGRARQTKLSPTNAWHFRILRRYLGGFEGRTAYEKS